MINKRPNESDLSMITTLLIQAAYFAACAHAGQRRKDAAKTPYINHCIEVAHILATEAGISDPRILAAALLHDTVEDTDTTAEDLQAQFGQEIRSWIIEMTDNKALAKQRRKEIQIEHAHELSHEACLIKIADKIANLRSLHLCPPVDWPQESIQQYFIWARQVVDCVLSSNPNWQGNPGLEASFRASADY